MYSFVNEHLYALFQGVFGEQQAVGRISLRLPSGNAMEPSRTIKNNTPIRPIFTKIYNIKEKRRYMG